MTTLSGLHTGKTMEGTLARISRYYSRKVLAHGATPAGADWPCEQSQQLRFIKLLGIVGSRRAYSLNDLGCGYGALLAFLAKRMPAHTVDYAGFDLSPAMVAAAEQLSGGAARFSVAPRPDRAADFSVGSGLFNVRLRESATAWEAFIMETMDAMRDTSNLGFAVNFLAPLDPGTRGARELYRAHPFFWRDFCAERYAARVDLVAGYGLREFTLLIRYPVRREARPFPGRR